MALPILFSQGIASLSHDQNVQFTTVRYLGDLQSSRRNATEAIRTSKFDIPMHEMYLTLFISAFAAATILPAQSEALLAYQVSMAPDAVVKLVAVATLGNVLGATFNWWLGRLTENLRAKKWFPVKEKQLHKAERFYGSYGRYSLLLSWVPIIGDPITVVAGILREPLLSFVLLVTIAKCARYVFVVGLAAFLF